MTTIRVASQTIRSDNLEYQEARGTCTAPGITPPKPKSDQASAVDGIDPDMEGDFKYSYGAQSCGGTFTSRNTTRFRQAISGPGLSSPDYWADRNNPGINTPNSVRSLAKRRRPLQDVKRSSMDTDGGPGFIEHHRC